MAAPRGPQTGQDVLQHNAKMCTLPDEGRGLRSPPRVVCACKCPRGWCTGRARLDGRATVTLDAARRCTSVVPQVVQASVVKLSRLWGHRCKRHRTTAGHSVCTFRRSKFGLLILIQQDRDVRRVVETRCGGLVGRAGIEHRAAQHVPQLVKLASELTRGLLTWSLPPHTPVKDQHWCRKRSVVQTPDSLFVQSWVVSKTRSQSVCPVKSRPELAFRKCLHSKLVVSCIRIFFTFFYNPHSMRDCKIGVRGTSLRLSVLRQLRKPTRLLRPHCRAGSVEEMWAADTHTTVLWSD